METRWSAKVGSVDDAWNEFRPLYFFPPLAIFKIPGAVPIEVKRALENSFTVFFADPGSAGNHCRSAVEEMLTNKGVRRYSLDKAGQRRFLSLASRIDIYKKQDPETCELLNAIRWLGNASSHPGGVTGGDVLDAYEIISEVLNEVYAQRRRRIRSKAARIVRRKGPLSSKWLRR